MKRTVLLILLSSMLPPAVSAQSNFFHAWEDRVRATSARQPAWPVPVIASPSTIVQLARVDFVRQYTSAHTLTWNYDNGKGVNLIPFAPTEFDINLPPYIQHNTPKVADGAGDLSMIAKYRPFASVRRVTTRRSCSWRSPCRGELRERDRSVDDNSHGGTRQRLWQVRHPVRAGWGAANQFVPQIGRTIQWNTTAQYRVGKCFWPEVEANASYYHGGANDGKSQVFLTPGMMVSKIKLRKDPKDRLGLVMGTGMQIATSSFHSYNHGLVLTGRIVF